MSALALAAGALYAGSSQAAVDPANAGQILTWGVIGGPAGPELPASITSKPIAQIAPTGPNAMFLTAGGEVLTNSTSEKYQPPSSLRTEKVESIAGSTSGQFAAITADGDLVLWGEAGASLTTTGVDVSDLVQVSISGTFGVGVKEDGTVVAWGANTAGQTDVPTGLTGVKKVVTGDNHTYALKNDGSVVAWGSDFQGSLTHVPAALANPGQVKDIAARSNGGLALLTDNTVVSWGQKATGGVGSKYNLPPASLAGKTITAIDASANANVALDSEGGITTWGGTAIVPDDVPAGLDGRTLSTVRVSGNAAFAVVPKVMTISQSAVAGTAKQGSKLTGTPATFSGGPEVAHQWLANGTPIAGATATTFTLTAAQVGKKITFRTTGTKAGETVTSDSSPTATVTAPPQPKLSSKTVISKPKVKKTKASFTVKVTRSGGTPTGKVKITVKRGAKKVYSKSVTLKKGVAKVALKKLKKGKHKVTASYAGDSRTKPSSAKAQTFRVK